MMPVMAARGDVHLDEKVECARSLRALILKHRDETDEARRLAQPVVEALAELGILRAMVPRAAGGEEWDLPTAMRVIEELSTVDGAVGWVAGVGGGVNGIFGGWLPARVARSVFSGDPIGLCAGSGLRSGRASRVEGGYLLTGRWSFASSARHAAWFLAGYDLEGDDTPLEGVPVLFVPARNVSVVDTWHVGGMRGTGSHDFRVSETFVPSAHAANPASDAPQHPGPLYRLPLTLTVGSGLGPLALGMARGAVDCFVELMAAKTDRRTGARLGGRLTVQERLAQAEAAIRSGRAFLYEVADDVWGTVSSGGRISDRQVALFRMANTNAMESGARAIDLVYHAAGMDSVYVSSLMERFFRDIHVASQHRHASPEEMYQAGQVLLNGAQA